MASCAAFFLAASSGRGQLFEFLPLVRSGDGNVLIGQLDHLIKHAHGCSGSEGARLPCLLLRRVCGLAGCRSDHDRECRCGPVWQNFLNRLVAVVDVEFRDFDRKVVCVGACGRIGGIRGRSHERVLQVLARFLGAVGNVGHGSDGCLDTAHALIDNGIEVRLAVGRLDVLDELFPSTLNRLQAALEVLLIEAACRVLAASPLKSASSFFGSMPPAPKICLRS